MNSFRFNVGSMGFFGRGKRTESLDLAVDSKRSDEFATLGPVLNAHQTGLVILVRTMGVLAIERGRYVAQIAKAVICRLSVDVVHIMRRMNSGHVKPCQPGGSVRSSIDVNVDVPTALVQYSRNVSNSATAFIVGAARKKAAFRVVVQKFAQALCCDSMFAHFKFSIG
jgi:hypothetical protein